MAIVLSDISAALFWESYNSASHPNARRVLAACPDSPPCEWGVERVKELLPKCTSDRLHVLVSKPELRRSLKDAVCHVHSSELPPGSLFQIADDVFVVSPELNYVEMARHLTTEQLIHFGMMLCGIFSRDFLAFDAFLDESGSIPRREKRNLARRSPLTTVANLSAYMGQLQDFKHVRALKGVKAAASALPFVIERSRSPMESSLAMALTLPYRMGGCSMPKPALNRPIFIDHSFVPSGGGVRWDARGTPYFECDLVWEGVGNVILEYHGDEIHFTREGVEKDARKARILAASGYSVHVATLATMSSSLKFWELVGDLRRELKFRLQPGVSDFEKRNERLRSLLKSDYLQSVRIKDRALHG